MTRPVLVGTAAIATAILAACSSSEPDADGVSRPQANLVAEAGRIDGRLSADRSATVRLAERVCAELAKGRSVEEVVGDAQRFTQGEGTISREQAAELVEQAKEHLCP